jgi:broad-specificity NMP kinase
MVKRVIAVGGEPATGKTTLMREFKNLHTTAPFKYGQVKGEYNKDMNLYFIGVFDGSTFEGTDRLSMSVQPDFIKFLNWCDGVVIFEGDRLFNQSLFTLEFPFVKVVLRADKETLITRHNKRGDSQTETFLKSKRTKINNILDKNPDVLVLKSETPTLELLEVLKKLVRDVK